VLEGDWGGQIYLSVRVDAVAKERVEAALRIINEVEWTCNDGEGLDAYQMKSRPGRPIGGGMGGGTFPLGRIWMHSGLNSGLATWAEPFLFGEVGLPKIEQIIEWLRVENRSFRHWSHERTYKHAQAALILAQKCMNTTDSPQTNKV